MVHAYHLIFGAYGFWLPNDPRGSWSDFVGSWELVRFGRATRSADRAQLTEAEEQQRLAAKKALKYPPVAYNGEQARIIASGFANRAGRSGLAVWACSILPEHVHLVVARHRYPAEQIVNLMKGEATKQLTERDLHPLSAHVKPGESPPVPWARGQWKVFLDTEEAIENAIRYVLENPIKEGKRQQRWQFVTPFSGLDTGWVTYT